MGRYVEKSEAILAWDEIRGAVMDLINRDLINKRARLANRIIPVLQEEFDSALGRGVLMELKFTDINRVEQMVQKAISEAGS